MLSSGESLDDSVGVNVHDARAGDHVNQSIDKTAIRRK